MADADQNEPRGLRCPRCGCAHFYTTNTQRLAGRVRRYKACRHCGRRIVTYEVLPSALRPPQGDCQP